MKNLGKNLGMIFQIIDDILDYSADQKTLGKDIGNDFFEGKVTLPIIKTYQKADLQEKKFIEETFSKNMLDNNKNFDDFVKILALINKYQALDDPLLPGKRAHARHVRPRCYGAQRPHLLP